MSDLNTRKFYPIQFEIKAKTGEFTKEKDSSDSHFIADGALFINFETNTKGMPQFQFTLFQAEEIKDPQTLFLMWLSMGKWVLTTSLGAAKEAPKEIQERTENFCTFIKQVIAAAAGGSAKPNKENSDGSKRTSTVSEPTKGRRVHKKSKKTSKSNGRKGTGKQS